MIKKTMFAACLAALAFAALPALAAAATNDPGQPTLFDGGKEIKNTKFTTANVAGNEPALTAEGLPKISCKSVEGEGEFIDEETGAIRFMFKGCHGPLNAPCTSSGAPEEKTITTTALTFHLKTVDHNEERKPGVLITPNEGHFATFSCPLVGEVKVDGNGLVGTITEPAEEQPSNTATLVFQSEKTGVQTHRKVTGSEEEYDLKSTVGGNTLTSSEDAVGTITFAEGMKPEIRTTST